MISKDDCYVYKPEIKRVTKANSFVASGRIIYMVKKDIDGKSLRVYNAYDKDTKILLGSNWCRDFLITFIQKQDLSCLGETEGSLF